MARPQNHLTCRKRNSLAGVVDLEGLGFTVLRFEDRFVFQEPEIVLNETRKAFRKKIKF